MKTQDQTKQMLEFIERSPSAFHVIENCRKELEAAGYTEQKEQNRWKLKPGGKYFAIRGDASMIAWQMPEGEIRGYHIAAAHSDSPSFMMKENPEMEIGKYIRLNTEKYGGMITSTWLDRALSVAGRIAVEENGQAVSRLVNIDRDLLVIPNLAIHMDRKLNQGYEYNAQKDLLPVYSDLSGKNTFLSTVAEAAGVRKEQILAYDLFLYVREKGRRIGRAGEWVLSPRLDDQQCVYGMLQAIKEAESKEYVKVAAVFHNEEVGSGTRQGADSTFLEDVLLWIAEAAGDSMGDYRRKLSRSFLISADNAHGMHPNRPDRADPTNQPVPGEGIVIKYHGGQKYTTDAMTSGRLKLLCRNHQIPYQIYHNRSDIAGGSTLGNISISHVSVPSVDIGLAQLAMHSAVEMAGTEDIDALYRLFRAFYRE